MLTKLVVIISIILSLKADPVEVHIHLNGPTNVHPPTPAEPEAPEEPSYPTREDNITSYSVQLAEMTNYYNEYRSMISWAFNMQANFARTMQRSPEFSGHAAVNNLELTYSNPVAPYGIVERLETENNMFLNPSRLA